MKTLFDSPARRKRKPGKLYEAWSTIIYLKQQLKRERIEKRNLIRLLGVRNAR